MIVPPGFRSPARSAASIIGSPIRSLTGERAQEGLTIDAEERDIRRCDDGGGPRDVADERDLAEPVAGSQAADLRSADGDAEAPVDDQVEAIADLAGPDDRRTRGPE